MSVLGLTGEGDQEVRSRGGCEEVCGWWLVGIGMEWNDEFGCYEDCSSDEGMMLRKVMMAMTLA